MPELPEVETMRRGILSVVGAEIAAVQFPPCQLKPISVLPSRPQFRKRLLGRTVEAVGRRGKRVILHLDARLHLVIEPRMTGLVLLADPPDLTHLRVGWRLTGVSATQLWFWDRRGLGTVTLLNDQQLEQQLGPDPARAGCAGGRHRSLARPVEVQSTRHQGCPARPEGDRRRRQSVRLGNPPRGANSSSQSLLPADARPVATAAPGDATRVGRGHFLRRFHLVGRYVPQRAEPSGWIPKSPPCLWSCRSDVSILPGDAHQTDGASAAFDVLVSCLPTAVRRADRLSLGKTTVRV